MKAEDVPQKWRTLMIGFLQEAFDEAMLADSYADIERMVDEGVAAVAPLIAAALEAEVTELRRNKGSWEDDARVWQADAMRLRADVAALVEALEAADQFIRNGIELGYIRMPDAGTPDPAHKTPAKIEAALARVRQA